MYPRIDNASELPEHIQKLNPGLSAGHTVESSSGRRTFYCSKCQRDTLHNLSWSTGGMTCQECKGYVVDTTRGWQPPRGNKYFAKRTWSELCQVWFASKGEAEYGEVLWFRQKAGEISRLRFHVKFVLCSEPKRRTVEVDYVYFDEASGLLQYEEFKGKMTRDYETRTLWLYQLDGIEVKLIGKEAKCH